MTSLQTRTAPPVDTDVSLLPTVPADGAVGVGGDVVAAARKGDQAAWEEIYRHFGPHLTRYAASRGVDDPEDLTQDVMYVAAEQLHFFTGEWDNLRSWLFTIAYRRCADHHRRRYRSLEVLTERPPEHVDPHAAADATIWADGESREAVAALDILTEREREIITLRVIGELGTGEVAGALGLSRTNVRVIQSRALAKLRRHLESNGGHLDKRFRSVSAPLAIALEKMKVFTRLGDMREVLPTDGRLGPWAETLHGGPLASPSNLAVTAAAAADVAARAAAMGSTVPGAAAGLGHTLVVVAIAAAGAGAVVGMPTPVADSPAPPAPPAVASLADDDTVSPAGTVEKEPPGPSASPISAPVEGLEGVIDVGGLADTAHVSHVLGEPQPGLSDVTDLARGAADTTHLLIDELVSVGGGTPIEDQADDLSSSLDGEQDPGGVEETATGTVTDTDSVPSAGVLDGVAG